MAICEIKKPVREPTLKSPRKKWVAAEEHCTRDSQRSCSGVILQLAACNVVVLRNRICFAVTVLQAPHMYHITLPSITIQTDIKYTFAPLPVKAARYILSGLPLFSPQNSSQQAAAIDIV